MTNDHDTMFMAKYHADGTPEWTHQAGGAYPSSMSVTLDKESNPLFIGEFLNIPLCSAQGHPARQQ